MTRPDPMVSRRAILSTAGALLLINGTRAGAQLLVFVIIGRTFGLGVAGNYALALAVATPIFLMLELGLRVLYLTRPDDDNQFRVYLWIRFIAVLTALTASVVAASLFQDVDYTTMIGVAGIKAIDSLADLLMARSQARGDNARLITASALNGVMTVLLVLLVLKIGWGLPALLTGSAVGSAITLVFLSRRQPHAGRVCLPVPKRGHAQYLISRGIAVGASLSFVAMISAMPQYFLSWSRDETEVAKFAILLYAFVIFEMGMNALIYAYLPRLLLRARNGDLSRRATVRLALSWGLRCAPAAIAFAIANWLVTPRLFGTSSVNFFPDYALVCAGLLLTPMVFVAATAVNARNLYGKNLISSLTALTAGAVTSYALIPSNGVSGALVAYLVALGVRISLTLAAIGSPAVRAHIKVEEQLS